MSVAAWTIRSERAADIAQIGAVTTAAFERLAFSDQTEARMIERLRAAGALTVSLVAVEEEAVVGHVAFSIVTFADGLPDWYGLGPLAVRPDRQGRGVGTALVLAGLEAMRDREAAGCVVLGDPAYYGRFGFTRDPALTYQGASEHFQRIVFNGPAPQGEVAYHPAFGGP